MKSGMSSPLLISQKGSLIQDCVSRRDTLELCTRFLSWKKLGNLEERQVYLEIER